MHDQLKSRQYQYTARTHVRERPLHWCIILLSLLFIFLLVIESVAFIVLGTWHLTVRNTGTVVIFSSAIYQRELSFGILLVIIGSIGIFISILGLIAFFTLRLSLLKIFAVCLWFVMIVGIVVGIIGIIFASQIDGFSGRSTDSNVKNTSYAEEKFMLGMNGGLSLFMSSTLLVGIIIVRCLSNDVRSYSSGQSYLQEK